MLRSFLTMYRMDIGIQTARIVTSAMIIPARKYPGWEDRTRFLQSIDDHFASVAGIDAASTTSAIPFGGGAVRQLEVDGRAGTPGVRLPEITMLSVGSRYFDAIGLSLVRVCCGGEWARVVGGTAGVEPRPRPPVRWGQGHQWAWWVAAEAGWGEVPRALVPVLEPRARLRAAGPHAGAGPARRAAGRRAPQAPQALQQAPCWRVHARNPTLSLPKAATTEATNVRIVHGNQKTSRFLDSYP